MAEALSETPEGLILEGRFILDTTEGREAHSLAKAGALALSVGFTRLSDRPRMGGGRIITEARLAEISVVSVASNPKARITEVRGNPAACAASTKEGATMPKENGAPEERAEKTPEPPTVETRVATLSETVATLSKDLEEERARADKLEARMGRTGLTPGNDNQPPAETRAFTAFLRRGRESMGADELRSLRVADDTAGGFLVPDDFRTEILKNLVEISPMRQAARVTSTASGAIILPKRTSTPTARWVGETETRTGTESAYGQVEIPVHEMACYVDVSQQLLEDSAVNVQSEVSMDLAEEFARLEGVAFTSGDGAKKPMGIMSDSGLSSTLNGHATTLQGDGLISIKYAMPAYYRNRAAWMLNGTTIGSVRKMKNATTGEYFWRDSLAEGQPPTLLGRPVIENPEMPDIEANAFPILFGVFGDAYRIVDRVSMSILRDPFTVATSGLVRFHARRRVGGGTVKSEAVKALKMATS